MGIYERRIINTVECPIIFDRLSFQIYTCQATNGHVVPPKSTYAKMEMRRKLINIVLSSSTPSEIG